MLTEKKLRFVHTGLSIANTVISSPVLNTCTSNHITLLTLGTERFATKTIHYRGCKMTHTVLIKDRSEGLTPNRLSHLNIKSFYPII